MSHLNWKKNRGGFGKYIIPLIGGMVIIGESIYAFVELSRNKGVPVFITITTTIFISMIGLAFLYRVKEIHSKIPSYYAITNDGIYFSDEPSRPYLRWDQIDEIIAASGSLILLILKDGRKILLGNRFSRDCIDELLSYWKTGLNKKIQRVNRSEFRDILKKSEDISIASTELKSL